MLIITTGEVLRCLSVDGFSSKIAVFLRFGIDSLTCC